jgi:cytochrome bd-type quinol oxidase subunit 2
MIESTFEYWNKLAGQTITISSLLGGFTIAVIANFLVSETKTRLTNNIMGVSTLAASFFLITVFAMTKLLMMTTDGYPFKVVDSDLLLSRIVGLIAFIFGIISLLTMIFMSGWTKSRKMGFFTTAIGVLTFFHIDNAYLKY